MKNKSIFAIILILLIIILVGIGIYFWKMKNTTPTNSVVVDGSNLLFVDDKGNTDFNKKELDSTLARLPTDSLTEDEKTGLIYMREEEKLAHDVYQILFEKFRQNVFDNISKSELTHTEAVKTLLDRYALEDPALNKTLGEFVNPDLKKLYVDLLNKATNIKAALEVGAVIEEIDIQDLQKRLKETDKPDIEIVYNNLMRGSRNHLRAFATNFKRLTGQEYSPQYLSSEEYKAIVSDDIERQGMGLGNSNK